MKKSLKIFFGLSVLMNLIIIGLVIGMTAKWHWGDGIGFAPQPMRSGMFNHILEDVSNSNKRAELQQKFTLLQETSRQKHADIREGRRKIRQLLKTEPFDQSGYNTAIAEILAAKQSTEHAYAELLGQVIQALPIEDRKDATKWLYRGDRKKGKKN